MHIRPQTLGAPAAYAVNESARALMSQDEIRVEAEIGCMKCAAGGRTRSPSSSLAWVCPVNRGRATWELIHQTTNGKSTRWPVADFSIVLVLMTVTMPLPGGKTPKL